MSTWIERRGGGGRKVGKNCPRGIRKAIKYKNVCYYKNTKSALIFQNFGEI